jgi:hypothetical protein
VKLEKSAHGNDTEFLYLPQSNADIKLSAAAFRPGRHFRLSRHRSVTLSWWSHRFSIAVESMIVERRYLLLPTGSCDSCEERRKQLNDPLLPRMCQFFFANVAGGRRASGVSRFVLPRAHTRIYEGEDAGTVAEIATTLRGHQLPLVRTHVDELVPGGAAVVNPVACEDAVGDPVVAQELPDVFDRIEFGTLRRQRTRVMFSGTTRRRDRCQPA